MITRDSIEAAYCFFHQKLRVYEFSTDERQRDDIEYAISQYVEGMNRELYATLAARHTAHGSHFLLDHTSFEQDLRAAVDMLGSL